MNAPNPFDMIRQSVLAIQTQNELAAARIEIARLKAEVERLQAQLAAKEGRGDA